MARRKFVYRLVNTVEVAQRTDNGFINGTAMCRANDKKIVSWFRTKDTLEFFIALAEDLGMETKGANLHLSNTAGLSAKKYAEFFPGLVIAKSGSPDNGGGTWLHYDAAVQLGQWCNKRFAIQVSRWVREWISTHHRFLSQAELDRVESRDYLRDKARKELVGQVKSYLIAVKRYVEGYREGYFKEVHDALNQAITAETASEMRVRISCQLGREIKQRELIRDYFPSEYLHLYIAMCNVIANLIRQGTEPLDAVETAKELALPHAYIPKPIDAFEESTKALKMKYEETLRRLPA